MIHSGAIIGAGIPQVMHRETRALVVQRLDNAIHWIKKLYPVDNTICLAITYLLDSNLSVE